MKHLLLTPALLFAVWFSFGQTTCTNIILNENFTAPGTGLPGVYDFGNPDGSSASQVPYWFGTLGTADYITSTVFPNQPNARVASVFGATGNIVEEAIAQDALMPKGNYLLSFDIISQVPSSPSQSISDHLIQITFSSPASPDPPYLNPTAFDRFIHAINVPANNTTVHPRTMCITTTQDWSRIEFYNKWGMSITPNGTVYQSNLLLDNIQLIYLGISAYPDIVICPGDPAPILAQQECTITGETYQWSIVGGGNISGANSATYTPVPAPTVTTTYRRTRTMPGGCSFTDDIVVEMCCTFKFPIGDEAFEIPYIGPTEITSQSPPGFSEAPLAVSISLPTAPTALSQYNTPGYGNITITQLKTIMGIAASSPTITSSRWVFLNCDIVVDQHINFLNCPFVRIAPGVKIIVQTGKNFLVTNSTFAAKCGEMWGGITGTGTSTTIKISNSNILHAETAVTSNVGAMYQLDGSRFIDNHTAVYVTPFAGTHSGTIQNCYFGDHPTANLLQPYASMDRPYYGVRLDRVGNVIIGNPNGVNGGNLFHRQQTGIANDQSNMVVKGNTFYRIVENFNVFTTAGAPGHTAISAKGVIIVPTYPHWMSTIGGTATQDHNLFLTCRDNIYLGANMNADIQGNLFKNITYHGIRAETNVSGSLWIIRNYFGSQNSNAYGARVYQYGSSYVNVQENDINQTFFNLAAVNQPAPRFGAGIYLSNVAAGSVAPGSSKVIYQNRIYNAVYGVMTINVAAPNISKNQITLGLSSAVILSDPSYDYTGIYSAGSPGSNIRANNFQYTPSYNPATSALGKNDLAGIRLENSFASSVIKNLIVKTPAGFYALFQNGSSKIYCNEFAINKFGFEFYQAEIGIQGLPANSSGYPYGLGADNKWTITWPSAARSEGTIVDYVGGSAQPYVQFNRMWYYHTGTQTYNSNPVPSLSAQFYTDQPLVSTASGSPRSACIDLSFQNPSVQELIDERTRSLTKFINEIDPTDPQMRYAQLSTYQKLIDENLVVLGDATDAAFQTFVNNFEETASYTVLQVQNLIDAGLTQAAGQLNLTIPETDPFSILNKEVQGIYLASLDSETGLCIINENQQARLEQIACMNPLDAGSAIYQARAMLGWLFSCDQESAGIQAITISGIEENLNPLSSLIYPNPSDGVITISNSQTNLKSIKFVDVTGTLVKEVSFEETSKRTFETKLHPGIYMVTIELENGTIETQRLIVR